MVDIVSVCLDLETDFDADIRLYLRAPNGLQLELSTGNGGGGDHYTQTCFTPVATVPITAGAPPFTGEFQPEGNWGTLINAPINGDWSLRIEDLFGINAYGNLNWWSITFKSDNELNYTWTPSSSLSCLDCPDPVITPQTSESLYVTTTDFYNCSLTDTVEVDVISNFAAPNVSCAEVPGGQIIVNWDDVAPGNVYEININGTGWQAPNNGPLSHIITGLVNGDDLNIEVQVDINGATCSVDIGTSFCEYTFCPLFLDISPPGPYAVSCNGLCDENIQISVSNGVAPFTFDVTNLTTGDAFSQTNGQLDNLCPGNYEVVVTDDTNCSETITFTVNDQPSIVITVLEDSPVTCNGGTDGCASVSAVGGVDPIAFLWDDPNQSTGLSICNLPAGPITVTATDFNGCTATGQVDITEPLPITLDLSKVDVNCLGGNDGEATVTPAGGIPPYMYQWSGGTDPNNATTGGLMAGNYSVTVEDSNGCEAFGDIDILEPMDGLEVEAIQTVISCFGANGSEATAIPMGGSPPYEYSWTPSFQNTQTATNLPVGPFIVVVTDMSGCTATDTVSLSQWDPVDISLAATLPSCFGVADGAIAANIVTGGAGNYNFMWNTGDTDDFINGVMGDLTYTVTVTDQQGCSGTASEQLDNPLTMELSIDLVDASCLGSADGNAFVTDVVNNQGMVSYQWDANAGNQVTPAASGLAAGNYNVVVTDTAGCTVSETITINEPPAILTSFVTTDNECAGDEEGTIDMEVIGGTPGYTISWSTGANSEKLVDLPADTFYVMVLDANGCEHFDSVIIEEPFEVNTNLEVTNVSCFGDRDGSIRIVPLGGIPPYTYSLDGDNYFGSSTFIALRADSYSIYLKDSKGCIYQTGTQVMEPPEIGVEIIANGQNVDELMIFDGEFSRFGC